MRGKEWAIRAVMVAVSVLLVLGVAELVTRIGGFAPQVQRIEIFESGNGKHPEADRQYTYRAG